MLDVRSKGFKNRVSVRVLADRLSDTPAVGPTWVDAHDFTCINLARPKSKLGLTIWARLPKIAAKGTCKLLRSSPPLDFRMSETKCAVHGRKCDSD